MYTGSVSLKFWFLLALSLFEAECRTKRYKGEDRGSLVGITNRV